jgi:DNA-binding MarR family transcriptional regulator
MNDAAGADHDEQWLTEDEQAAWRSLAGLLIKLPATLDARLQRDSGLSLFEYFVLSGLSEAPDRTLRMSDLAVVTNGSLSRLSHVVKRLERRGWVRREPCPDDGRYTHAILTEAGWQKVVEAAPGHAQAVRALVIDPLTVTQRRAVHEIGHRVLRRIDPDDPDPCSRHRAAPAPTPNGSDRPSGKPGK